MNDETLEGEEAVFHIFHPRVGIMHSPPIQHLGRNCLLDEWALVWVGRTLIEAEKIEGYEVMGLDWSCSWEGDFTRFIFFLSSDSTIQAGPSSYDL